MNRRYWDDQNCRGRQWFPLGLDVTPCGHWAAGHACLPPRKSTKSRKCDGNQRRDMSMRAYWRAIVYMAFWAWQVTGKPTCREVVYTLFEHVSWALWWVGRGWGHLIVGAYKHIVWALIWSMDSSHSLLALWGSAKSHLMPTCRCVGDAPAESGKATRARRVGAVEEWVEGVVRRPPRRVIIHGLGYKGRGCARARPPIWHKICVCCILFGWVLWCDCCALLHGRVPNLVYEHRWSLSPGHCNIFSYIIKEDILLHIVGVIIVVLCIINGFHTLIM